MLLIIIIINENKLRFGDVIYKLVQKIQKNLCLW